MVRTRAMTRTGDLPVGKPARKHVTRQQRLQWGRAGAAERVRLKAALVKRMQVRTAGGKFMVKGADKFFA